jgi:glycine cleavage system H protein
MARLENFLGTTFELSEDLRYVPKLGLWAKQSEGGLVFGLTGPALLMSGGINDLEWLVPAGQRVSKGETVVFAITAKLLYLDAPVPGRVDFNLPLAGSPARVAEDPYGEGWLFRIEPENLGEGWESLSTAQEYVQALADSDGSRNPSGASGRGSGVCKAIYGGIRGQRL